MIHMMAKYEILSECYALNSQFLSSCLNGNHDVIALYQNWFVMSE